VSSCNPPVRRERPRHGRGAGRFGTGESQGHIHIPAGNTGIYPAWEALVRQYLVLGKPSHDARLVAAMQVHGIKDILTFDRTGFTRYSGIEVVNPADVVSSIGPKS
jgi:hypothetical protein